MESDADVSFEVITPGYACRAIRQFATGALLITSYVFGVHSDATHYPQQGDSVKVHYRGYLADGSLFDSSYDRDQPLHFRLGAGQVIRGKRVTPMIFRKTGHGSLMRSCCDDVRTEGWERLIPRVRMLTNFLLVESHCTQCIIVFMNEADERGHGSKSNDTTSPRIWRRRLPTHHPQECNTGVRNRITQLQLHVAHMNVSKSELSKLQQTQEGSKKTH